MATAIETGTETMTPLPPVGAQDRPHVTTTTKMATMMMVAVVRGEVGIEIEMVRAPVVIITTTTMIMMTTVGGGIEAGLGIEIETEIVGGGRMHQATAMETGRFA